MELFWKAAAAVLLTTVLSLALGKQGKDISVLLTMAGCCLVAVAAVFYLTPALDLIRELADLADTQGQFLGILLKAVGIALVSEAAGILCADAGTGSLGKMLQMLGSAVILFLSVPVFEGLLTLIREILGAL